MKQGCLFLSIAALISLSGCTVTPEECDPSSDTGFSDKLKCEAFSDGYEQNVEQVELTLQEKKAYQQALQETYAALDEEQSEVRGELKDKSAEYTSLNKAMNDLLSMLLEKAGDNQALQQEIKLLEGKLDTINQDQGSVLEKKQQLQDLQQQISDLESVLGL